MRPKAIPTPPAQSDVSEDAPNFAVAPRDRPKTFRASLCSRPTRPKADRSPAILLHPVRPEGPPKSRIRSVGLALRFDSGRPPYFPVRSSGPGAILRRVSAFPATGGPTNKNAEAFLFAFAASAPLQVAPFDGLARRLAEATMIDQPEGKPLMSDTPT